MKILTTILSLYVMLLAGVSCPDEWEFSKDKSTIVQAHTPNEASCPGDICSPFCSCACSPVFAKVISVKVQNHMLELITRQPYYQLKLYYSDTYPPFQPPKA